MTRLARRIVLAPVLTGALLLIMWTVPLWSDEPEDSGVTVRVEPQLMGAGDSPAPSRDAGYGVDVEVAGSTAGHEVRLETWSEGAWRSEDEGTTDDEGHVRLESEVGAYGRILTEVDGSPVVEQVIPAATGPSLWWSEEFDGDVLNFQWLVVQQPNGGGNCTYSTEQATDVSDGVLTLSVVENQGHLCKSTGLPVRHNGHIVLRGSLGYGTTAARIRFPSSRGVVGQFWLQPGNVGDRWVMDDEHEGVVVAGTAGTDQDPRLDTAVHQTVRGALTTSRRVMSPTDAPTDGRFHVYSVEWTPTGYTFKIDGRTIRTVEASGPPPPMSIGLAVLAPRDRLPADPASRTMVVDWLRVWGQ